MKWNMACLVMCSLRRLNNSTFTFDVHLRSHDLSINHYVGEMCRSLVNFMTGRMPPLIPFHSLVWSGMKSTCSSRLYILLIGATTVEIIILCQTYLRYLIQTNVIILKLLSTIKWTKFHLSIAIITQLIIMLCYLFFSFCTLPAVNIAK